MIPGSLQKKLSAEMNYKDTVKVSSSDALTSKQNEEESLCTGILCQILQGLAWLYPDFRYAQIAYHARKCVFQLSGY